MNNTKYCKKANLEALVTGSVLRPLFPLATTGLAGLDKLDFRAGAVFGSAVFGSGIAPAAATRLRSAGFFMHRSVSVSQVHSCSLNAWSPSVGHFSIPTALR